MEYVWQLVAIRAFTFSSDSPGCDYTGKVPPEVHIDLGRMPEISACAGMSYKSIRNELFLKT